MIPFNELCRALDRYNRRRQGLPVAAEPEAPQAAAPAPLPPVEEAHAAPAYDHYDEPPQAAGGEQPAWDIAPSHSRHGEEPTGELYLDEINEVAEEDQPN